MNLIVLNQGHNHGDLLTYWLRSSDPDDDPDVTRIKQVKNFKSTEQHIYYELRTYIL